MCILRCWCDTVITGLRLELLKLMHSQIFWGWEGSLFLQVHGLYPVVIVDINLSLLDKRFELQWEKLLVTEFAESDKGDSCQA